MATTWQDLADILEVERVALTVCERCERSPETQIDRILSALIYVGHGPDQEFTCAICGEESAGDPALYLAGGEE